MNPDLASERSRATFDSRELAAFLRGGKQELEKRARTRQFYESHVELHEAKPPVFFEREERVENAWQKVVVLNEIRKKLDPKKYDAGYLETLVLAGEATPFLIHDVMFVVTLQGQATDEQKKKWLPLAQNKAINGTYAQTELGHGTNLRKLETTATYDARTQQFVLNTPTISAAKWWPGNLGKSTNFAVVVAQLYTNGQCFGSHSFLVQLRDLETHLPMPGIEIGDIGPKFSMASNDNGYLVLKSVRIPRDQMLMRGAKVTPTGDYLPPAHSKLGYGAMMFVRSVMILSQGSSLAAAATIAIRYSCVRRQGEIKNGEGEVKILDYQTQQFRILPQMAKAFAFYLAGRAIRQIYATVNQQVKDGNFELLGQLHFLSSGLKAVVSWDVAKGIEQCRLSCGGHGYMHASGLPELYAWTVGGCTYEGDNIVLLLQVARFLERAGRAAKSGHEQTQTTHYLSKPDVHHRSALDSSVKAAHIIEAFEHVAKRKVLQTVDLYDKKQQNGVSKTDAWNQCSVEFCQAARAHVRVFIVKNFARSVEQVKNEKIRAALEQMWRLFALDEISSRTGQFVEDGYMTSQQLEYIRSALYGSLASIRPNSVAFSDSWDFSDRELRSVLGRYDGQVYPNLLEWVKDSDLNKTQVLDSVIKYLLPSMKNAKAKM